MFSQGQAIFIYTYVYIQPKHSEAKKTKAKKLFLRKNPPGKEELQIQVTVSLNACFTSPEAGLMLKIWSAIM